MPTRSPCKPRTVLDAGIVAGAGGGIEKTLLAGARLHERAGFHSVLALVHPPSDLGFETLRARAAALGVELHDRAEKFPFSPLTVGWLARLCREYKPRLIDEQCAVPRVAARADPDAFRSPHRRKPAD